VRRCKRLSLPITRNCKHCDNLSPHGRGLLRSSWFRRHQCRLSQTFFLPVWAKTSKSLFLGDVPHSLSTSFLLVSPHSDPRYSIPR
jgi:hypothetical protein